MRNIQFYKYQGTGNDFILIDNRSDFFPKEDKRLITHLCHRHFGIGADGLILLENDSQHDFKMIFFNPDASQSMCGNGGRCVVAFARQLEIIKENCSFTAIDGLHKATISPEGIVNLQMNDVDKIEKHRKYVILNTGSPHHVELRKDIDNIDIKKEGAKIRYAHSIEGINVNFVEEINENTFKIRTYERGVEDETYSCGTGATAVAIAMHKLGKTQQNSVNLQTKGGDLQINFEVKNKLLGLKKSYENVWLCGMVKLIYKGDILCDY